LISNRFVMHRFVIILALIIFLQMTIQESFCLTDLDYSLRKLKYSEGSISAEQSFHGANSAKLSVFSKDRFARIYIDLNDPLPIQDLDQLSLWINPQAGSGSLQIEIYLDGNGNEKILSLKKSWDDLEMDASAWNEVDGFDLEYGDGKSLEAIKEEMKGKKIVKIYVTMYNDGGDGPLAEAFVDYVTIGNEVISFEPLEEEAIKDGPSSATAGGLMTYTITYGNNGLEPANVIVTENYDKREVFISSYPPPDPGTLNTWTFPALSPGSHGQITIKMRSIKPAATASISGKVSGRGYASTEGTLSTEKESYMITNTVYITAGEFNFSASASTRIRPIIGSALQYGEHGTGDYQADETLGYSSASISVKRSILAAASSSPVSLNLSPNRLSLRGDWSANLRAENDYRDIFWSDRFYEAKRLNLSYEARLGKTLSSLQTAAQVEGLADRAARWPNGLAETRLDGNFNLTGKARWRWANKTISPDKEWLECCPLEEQLQQY
jgi:hypothetical protein